MPRGIQVFPRCFVSPLIALSVRGQGLIANSRGLDGRLKKKTVAMDFSDYILDKMVKILPIFGTFLFAYNAYLQLIMNKDPLESAFSLVVFLTFLISVVSVSYGHSLPRGSEKEKERTLKVVVGLFVLVGVAFLIRAWMVLPSERAWVVPASCAVPALATLAFLVLHRRLSNSEVGK